MARKKGARGRSALLDVGGNGRARPSHLLHAGNGTGRNRGSLGTNSFVRLRKLFVDGEPVMEIDNLGDSEAVLTNKSYLRQTAQALMKRGVIPEEDGWGGWPGRYQVAVRKTSLAEIDRDG